MRELVQEPIKILSGQMSAMGVLARKPMYCKAFSMLVRLIMSVSAAGSGTHPSMATTMSGEVPHDTCGLMAAASSVSVREKTASELLRKVRQL